MIKASAAFLKKLNRRCVSQSRAKCGLYFVGNVKTLLETSHWATLIQKMHKKGCVGNSIKLCCPKHKNSTVISASEADDIPIGITFCREACTDIMGCQKHYCPKKCQPPHSHVSCMVQVSFLHASCGHPDVRECYKDESTLKCRKSIQFHFMQCGHLGTRQCYENESEMKCQERCPKVLSCKGKHPCEGLCSVPCDPDNCPQCAKIAKAEAEAKMKAEEKAREQARKEIQKKIEDIKNSATPSLFKREDLANHGDTASEYLDVQDQVMNFIQPGHNWYPAVTKIEKITNLALEQKWLESRKKRFDSRRTALKFHGTSADAVDKIVKDGFLIGSPGMYGAGVYFATDSSKSAQRIYTKGSNQLLLCEVLLGKSKTVSRAIPDMTLQKLKSEGYDSIYAQRGTKGTGGVLYDEFVVYDPCQAIPRYIVHYTCTSFGGPRNAGGVGLRSVNIPAKLQHHHLTPKREMI